MASLFVDNNGNTTMSLDCQILQATRLRHIHSSLSRCTEVPWHSFTLLASCLALVNDFHYWLVIQWFLPMLNFDTFIRMVRIVPWILALMKTNGFMESTTTCNSTFYWFLVATCSYFFHSTTAWWHQYNNFSFILVFKKNNKIEPI